MPGLLGLAEGWVHRPSEVPLARPLRRGENGAGKGQGLSGSQTGAGTSPFGRSRASLVGSSCTSPRLHVYSATSTSEMKKNPQPGEILLIAVSVHFLPPARIKAVRWSVEMPTNNPNRHEDAPGANSSSSRKTGKEAEILDVVDLPSLSSACIIGAAPGAVCSSVASCRYSRL